MRYNHFSMLPEQAFKQRAFGGMTLEGGSGGGGGSISQAITPSDSAFGTQQARTLTPPPPPPPPPPSAGGGFLGSGAPGNTVTQSQFNANRYLQQNPDIAGNPYYSQNPFEHYQNYGFVERRSPYAGFQYAPSQQPMYNQAYRGQAAPTMVNQAYQNILGRAPDQAGANYWNAQMQQGLTGQGLVGGFTSSPEFQRQQEYSRAYTEAFRPGYQEFGPSGQYYQPIYQSSYSQYAQPNRYYSPSYGGPSFRNPFTYMYEEGGPIKVGYDHEEDDQGIAALGVK